MTDADIELIKVLQTLHWWYVKLWPLSYHECEQLVILTKELLNERRNK